MYGTRLETHGGSIPGVPGAEDDSSLFGLENDVNRHGVGFFNMVLALGLFALLPVWLWIGNRLVRLLIDKCTRFQKKPTLDECIQTVVLYWNDLESSASETKIVGWHSCDHDGEMMYVRQTGTESGVNNIISSVTVDRNGDIIVNVNDDGGEDAGEGSRYNNNNSSNGGSGPILLRNKQKTSAAPGIVGYSSAAQANYREVKLVTSHLNAQRGTRHETERYLRTSMALFCYAIISLVIFFVVVTASFWSVGTDIVTVVSRLGIAWTAVWFNGGLATFLGNYISYLAILLTCRFTLGSLVKVEGTTKTHGCVISIEPLYTEIIVVEQTDSALLLDIKQVANITFFTVTISSFMQGQSAPLVKRKGGPGQPEGSATKQGTAKT